ncbi:hypothetical protein Tco_1363526 [Tanacetum coccineum]
MILENVNNNVGELIGNSQVKDNKIDLLVQQYEQFTILEEESIDSGFARFNTIITSLKALDEGFSSMNYYLEERVNLLGNQEKKRCHSDKEMRKKGKSDRKGFRCGDPNHLIGDCPKPSRNKDQKAFIGGSWSDSENDAEDKTNDETCLMAQSSNEVKLLLFPYVYSDNASSIDNDNLLEKEILELNEKTKKLKRSKEIEIACLGFDDSKVSTSGTKNMSFVGSSAEKATDGSTIKVHGSTLPGSVSRTYGEKGTKHVFSPPKSSRSDFVITMKKLIHNSIDESKKPSLKPSPKSGIGYVKTESRSKTPPPRRQHPSQQDTHTSILGETLTTYSSKLLLYDWNNQQIRLSLHMGKLYSFHMPSNCNECKDVPLNIFGHEYWGPNTELFLWK